MLVIVPCGQSKVWDREPERGAVAARHAYTGAPFKVNREYAERFADRWVILSARYGFVPPDYPIPGPYNVTFKRTSTGPVGADQMRRQVKEQGLDRFDTVVGLGGKEYRAMVEDAFAGTHARLEFPFAGLPISKAMQAVKQTVGTGGGHFLENRAQVASSTGAGLTNEEKIVAHLRAVPAGADDDELSSRLGIRPRQQVNQICRRLQARGVVTRQKDPVRGKSVNKWKAAK